MQNFSFIEPGSDTEDTNSILPKLLELLKPSFYLDKKQTKLLRYFARIYHYSDEIKLFHYSGVVGSTKNISDGLDNEITASGYSLNNSEIALLKFIGEACERFSQRVYRKNDFISSTFKDLNSSAIDIFQIASLSNYQRKQKYHDKFRFDENTMFNWTKGIDLFSGKEIFIPAQLIYLNYLFESEKVIYVPTSTGTAGGGNVYAAMLRAIYEVTERDHFLIAYLNNLSLPKIDLLSIHDDQIQELIELIHSHHFDIHVVDLTLDLHIPTYLTVILDKTGKGAAISMGLKCHLDKKSAIIGSITEAFHPRCWIRRIAEDNLSLIKKIKADKIVNLRDRALYWYSLNKVPDIQFLINGNRMKFEYTQKKYTNNQSALNEVLDKLARNKIKVYFKDITVSPIKSLGYHIIRVIIPQMIPFYLDERFRYLGGKRLYEVPKKLGYKKKILEFTFNKIPHPFL